MAHECQSESDTETEGSELSDLELQDAFSKGLLKPGLNVVEEAEKQYVNDVMGLKYCLEAFKKNIEWAERLDMTNGPAADIVAIAEGRSVSQQHSDIDPDDDFQREMYFYRQAQATALGALPRLQRLKIATKRPDDYFAEMAKSDQQMQKIREKMLSKQIAMEKSEKAKQLRALRKYGKKEHKANMQIQQTVMKANCTLAFMAGVQECNLVTMLQAVLRLTTGYDFQKSIVQVEVIQQRQKEKKAMLTAVKKYQKGLSDKLDFLEGDKTSPEEKKEDGRGGIAHQKRRINKKRQFKNEKFGFGGKKRGSKWNTKESHDDVSGFRAKVAHSKVSFGKGGKKNAKNKRPGKRKRQKMKTKTR